MKLKFLLTFFLLLIGGIAVGQKNPNKITAYEFRDSSSFMGTDGFRVYYLGDLIMYEIEYRFDSSATFMSVDSVTTIIDSINTDLVAIDSLVSDTTIIVVDSTTDFDTSSVTIDLFTRDTAHQEIRSYYMVYHKDSSFGITYYPKYSQEDGKREEVAPFLSRARNKNQIDQLLKRTPESSLWNSDKSVLVETYRFVQNADTPSMAIKLFYSSKMKDVTESLNAILDSVKQLKFFRAEFAIDSFQKDNMKSPPMFFSLEMRKIDLPDEELIRQYFEMYRKRLKHD